MQDERNLLVFSGNANKPLAQSICKELGVRMGKALVSTFSDGEVQVEIEESVRRQEVFVVQPTCAPSAENLMELLVLVDALKRASAACARRACRSPPRSRPRWSAPSVPTAC
jgi:ribose-phosphate pyrophosphokinase